MACYLVGTKPLSEPMLIWPLGYDNMAYVDHMNPDAHCPTKGDKINHSLTHLTLRNKL